MRGVCIHGHFYQPPRENPWTGEVPLQPSAAPFHDWNQRIATECYEPNVPNYERMSFNFGPTLLGWFEQHRRDLLNSVVDADRRARPRFGGHGPALAQAWGHAILPLCTPRDRRTQVLWGLKEFARRFGRQAEGFWLPETAVDTETLETLSLHGVSFTVLAPHQAEGQIDTRKAYRAVLPSGRSISLFFYDGPLSAAIAFEKLPLDGNEFARRLKSAFSARPGGQLVHVATDGETYGHHHPGGEDGLRVALAVLDDDPDVRLTCYGEYLEHHPPVDEVHIVERSSWSCPHELGRWTRHCGCASDESHEQHWREPVRAAVEDLRDRSADAWEARASALLGDPWAARDDWIEPMIDPSPERYALFLERHARPGVEPDRDEIAALFEFQQRVLQTETSCAWFFEDLARIETLQVLQYAARAIELGHPLLGLDLESPFLEILGSARSSDPEAGDGLNLWKTRVVGGK